MEKKTNKNQTYLKCWWWLQMYNTVLTHAKKKKSSSIKKYPESMIISSFNESIFTVCELETASFHMALTWLPNYVVVYHVCRPASTFSRWMMRKLPSCVKEQINHTMKLKHPTMGTTRHFSLEWDFKRDVFFSFEDWEHHETLCLIVSVNHYYCYFIVVCVKHLQHSLKISLKNPETDTDHY